MATDPAREKAIQFLLKPTAMPYIRSLKDLSEKDPQYIDANREDIGNILQGFLAGAGFHWTHEIFESEWPAILEEAIARLGTKA